MNNSASILAELKHYIDQLLASEQGPMTLAAINDQPTSNNKLLTILDALIAEGDQHNSDTWAAHMTPAISCESLLGQLVAGLHNGNLLSPQLYPTLAKIEQQIINWLCQLFQQRHGHFIAGSSYANLEALWQAKQHHSGAPHIVYASESAHYSIAKACQILDLKLQTIATDENDQLCPIALQQACEHKSPLAIVATAGTPALGAIDPLKDCIKLAQQFRAWCHIDAAWGGALSLLPEYSSLFNMLSQADSICFDPHKGWQQPKPASVLLYRRPLMPMLSADADYLQHPPLNSLPGSRGGEFFLPLWLTLMNSGVDSLRQQVSLRLEQAEQFSSQLEQSTNWQVYHSPTGIVCFHTDKVDLTHLVDNGTLSQAKIAGKDVYRAVFASPNTKADSLLTVLEPYF
ncbi:MAG TPA: aspartate aminotransferase family protein [Methylophaga sp.]|nr:aspartate aminotransferase family protein [Methylophaga sp.]